MSPEIHYMLVQQDHAERARRTASEHAARAERRGWVAGATDPGRLARYARRLPGLTPWSSGSRPA